jgi:hypothetical protein
MAVIQRRSRAVEIRRKILEEFRYRFDTKTVDRFVGILQNSESIEAWAVQGREDHKRAKRQIQQICSALDRLAELWHQVYFNNHLQPYIHDEFCGVFHDPAEARQKLTPCVLRLSRLFAPGSGSEIQRLREGLHRIRDLGKWENPIHVKHGVGRRPRLAQQSMIKALQELALEAMKKEGHPRPREAATVFIGRLLAIFGISLAPKTVQNIASLAKRARRRS